MNTTNPDVFLGGSCNPTTWRKDTAIPLLEAAEITYYNPQENPMDDWVLRAGIETKAKASAGNLLFVIDSQTRAISSMVEAAGYLSCDTESVYLVIDDVAEGTVIDGAPVGDRELRDLNRGRAYLRELAQRMDRPAYDNVTRAIEAIIADY